MTLTVIRRLSQEVTQVYKLTLTGKDPGKEEVYANVYANAYAIRGSAMGATAGAVAALVVHCLAPATVPKLPLFISTIMILGGITLFGGLGGHLLAAQRHTRALQKNSKTLWDDRTHLLLLIIDKDVRHAENEEELSSALNASKKQCKELQDENEGLKFEIMVKARLCGNPRLAGSTDSPPPGFS